VHDRQLLAGSRFDHFGDPNNISPFVGRKSQAERLGLC
jgi:hypothetical protein